MVKNFCMNRTKLIATIGPASSSEETVRAMIREGVDTFRLNFSHGTTDEHVATIRRIRQIARELKENIAILGDLQGPKIRITNAPAEGLLLEKGRPVTLTTVGHEADLIIDYEHLLDDIRTDQSIFIDDGKIKLRVVGKKAPVLIAEVLEGGKVYPHKGVNFPDSPLSVPSLTPKDRRDLEVAIREDVDWIALSFVRKPDDILAVKDVIDEFGGFIKVVAKIEKPEAVHNIEAIIQVADAVMVARGDLGVEMPMEEVPLIQKKIVKLCRKAAKPSIVATQVMESMVMRPVPSRAEVSDVTNAVLDGTDAVMLSNETSVGRYPVEVVRVVEQIIHRAEQEDFIYYRLNESSPISPTFLPDTVCYNAAVMAQKTNASGIVGMTRSGFTAFKLASHRPRAPIFIFSNNPKLLRTLRMVWGVEAFYYDGYESTDQTFEDVIKSLLSRKRAALNDIIVFTASMPIRQRGRTNTIHIRRIT